MYCLVGICMVSMFAGLNAFRGLPRLSLPRKVCSSLRSTSLMSTSVRVSTYNVLSSHLSAPDYFTSCKPDDLDANTRLSRVKAKLDAEIAQNSIISLQEVSMSWAGELHTYFSNNNYYFVNTLYGNKFNNYMGVGIAFPMGKFSLVDTNIRRLADTIYIRRMQQRIQEDKTSEYQLMYKSLERFFKFLLRSNDDSNNMESQQKPTQPQERRKETINDAIDRHNEIIALTLESKSSAKQFVVGTYHMPCMFQFPAVMKIHSALSTQYIQKISKGKPYIYCGDFNITPKSDMYELLTKGKIESDTDVEQWNGVLPDNWKLEVAPMNSAYAMKLKTEPEFTNYAKIRNETHFIDTLDYIFLSKDNWNVHSVKTLPTISSALNYGPMPTQSEPSDHLLLAANVSLI